MKGLTIVTDKNYIETVTQNSAQLSLLAKQKNTEIMLQEIKSEELFTLYPGNIQNNLEFFYVLEGSIKYEENDRKQILEKGDYFYVKDLKNSINFITLETTRLLYISNQPIFKYMSSEMKELKEIVEKVEAKDIYTHNHAKRVKDYSLKLAENLKLPREKFSDLGFAALFHDIGKINIPDSILNKPGPLSDKEYQLVKQHPLDGKKMVEKTFFQELGIIIEQHHENLDGSGYPHGLTGEEITVEAKIIRVVDSYDAMTSNRPYRNGMPPDKALAELKSLSNKHYDIKIVDSFKDILNEQMDNE